MATHALEPTPQTLHGHFSRDMPAVLEIDSGDTVMFRTLDGGWGKFDQPDPFADPVKVAPPIPALDDGHALVGPVRIRGAEPGMTLEVRIRDVRPGRWGWTAAGAYPSALNVRLGIGGGERRVWRWALDPDAGTARNRDGLTLPLRPFMGVMGMPPDLPGPQSTIPPRACGGNIDCRELVAGSRLFLPIALRGALFSVGDGHGTQGDGEVSGLAIECPMERVELEFHLRETPKLSMPRAHTPAGWITFGFHDSLDAACVTALDGMLDLIGELTGLDRRDAMMLASLGVSLRITQVVNELSGVHAILPDEVVDRVRARC